VTVEEFKKAVLREFGPHLEHATPANVREFLDGLQHEDHQERRSERIELNESRTTYEAILKDFFARVLDFPRDQALIMLWTLAFELSFSTLEHHLADQFDSLFRDFDNQS
jgi:hypothetical protein